MELDDELAETHASMRAIRELFGWQWARAKEEYLTSLRLNRSYVTARQWYALALAHRSRTTEAIAQMTVPLDDDPLSFHLNATTALIHYLGRDYAAAEERAHRALEINPHHEPAHFYLALSLQQQMRFDESTSAFGKALTISKGEPHVIAALGALEAQQGNVDAARGRLDALAALSPAREVSPVHFATVHAAMGDRSSALRWLDRAMETRSGWLVYLATEPRFDGLRDEPRFKEMIERVGLL